MRMPSQIIFQVAERNISNAAENSAGAVVGFAIKKVMKIAIVVVGLFVAGRVPVIQRMGRS
jgi:uncharacterized membrane protein (Fun14 family)